MDGPTDRLVSFHLHNLSMFRQSMLEQQCALVALTIIRVEGQAGRRVERAVVLQREEGAGVSGVPSA